MDKNDIIEYVMHTPHNTNRAVLSSMLNQLADGSGGGSSDFSTAEVTVNKEGTGDIPLNMSLPLPVVIENPSTHEKILGIVATPYNGTFVVPLYESRCYVGASGDWDSEWFSASGGVTRQGGAGFLIEGDGTITITIND